MKNLPSDTKLLNWIIFYGATIHCSRDGDNCWVHWFSESQEEDKETPIMVDAREAIVKAMQMENDFL